MDLPNLVAIDRALGITDRTTDGEALRRREAFALMAIEEMVRWAAGERPFASIPELDRFRVAGIFHRVRERDVPTVGNLVSDLGITAARAQSMLSRMRYEDAGWMRARESAHLVSEIDARLSDAKRHVEKDGHKTIVLQPSLHRQMLACRSLLYENDDKRALLATCVQAADGIGWQWAAKTGDWDSVKRALNGEAEP